MNKTGATELIVFLFIFTLFIFIGFMIDDKNLKISYILVILLILFTGLNLYMTINYYRKLRNDVGKTGSRGLKGETGPRGDLGQCVFTEKCGIKNCEDKIYSEIEKRNYYGDFNIECLKNPNKCATEDLKEVAQGINELIQVQIKKCKESKKDEKTLMNDLFPPLE